MAKKLDELSATAFLVLNANTNFLDHQVCGSQLLYDLYFGSLLILLAAGH